MSEVLYSRILGCMLGNTIGDAFGGPIEFKSARQIRELTGGSWVCELLPYPEQHSIDAFGVWEAPAPRGTGTDDTRNNQLFAECAIRNGGFINSQLLAMECIERYRDRAAFYPRHEDLAERHFRWQYRRACAHLGMAESEAGTPASVAAASGNSFPVLAGLISLAFAGLLLPGEPEKAYRKACELNFLDMGYALDATAMMAAMVSAALGGGITGREMVAIGLETDPFGSGRHGSEVAGGRIMAEWITTLLRIADAADDEQGLVDDLARAVAQRHPFDPIDALGVPMAAIHYCDGDPVQSIVISANDRDLDERGEFVGTRDVDCTASIAGALVGALRGADAFPADWVADTITANKQVYGIDVEENARRFCRVVHG